MDDKIVPEGHKRDCKRSNRNKSEKSAFAKHLFQKQQNFNFEKIELLDRQPIYSK